MLCLKFTVSVLMVKACRNCYQLMAYASSPIKWATASLVSVSSTVFRQKKTGLITKVERHY